MALNQPQIRMISFFPNWKTDCQTCFEICVFRSQLSELYWSTFPKSKSSVVAQFNYDSCPLTYRIDGCCNKVRFWAWQPTFKSYILQLCTRDDHLLGNFTASIGPLRWQMPSQPTNQFWISNTRNKHPNQTYWGHIYLLFLNVTRKSKNEQKNRPYNFVPRLRCSFKHHSQIENKSNHWGKMTWALWPIFWFLMFQFGSNLWTCASFLLLMSRKRIFAVFFH